MNQNKPIEYEEEYEYYSYEDRDDIQLYKNYRDSVLEEREEEV